MWAISSSRSVLACADIWYAAPVEEHIAGFFRQSITNDELPGSARGGFPKTLFYSAGEDGLEMRTVLFPRDHAHLNVFEAGVFEQFV